ncbi:MAG: hypothetical protein M1822_003021 [Bathelium mastoideum]|nr:MAG: hypothetical protein M1822_003021 [Bathelium mastoideum]
MSNRIALILGAGPNIGHHTALAFRDRGYSVALAARSLEDGRSEDGGLQIRLDLSDSAALPGAFAKVKEAFGNPPGVVVYNSASRTELDENDPLASLETTQVVHDMAVNAISPLIAAKCAVAGFTELPDSVLKTFIFTGNKLIVMPWPLVLTFGMGKTATAYAVATMVKAYGARGYRFYYTDERQKDGAPAMLDRNGPAHGALYTELAELSDQRPWHYTFVNGEGYQNFAEIDRAST